MRKTTYLAPEIFEQIKHAVCSVRYGTVQVTAHDARVVQIEKMERTRLQLTADPAEGSPDSSSSRADQVSGSKRLSRGEEAL